MTTISAPPLAPELLAGLAMVVQRPPRKNGNPWGLRVDIARELVDRGLIEVGTANDGVRSWEVWRATRLGIEVLADGDPE